MAAPFVGLTFLELDLPGTPLNIAGIIAKDLQNGLVILVMRERLDLIAAADDFEILGSYEYSLRALLAELGTESFLAYIESTFSHTVKLSAQYTINRPPGDLEAFCRALLVPLQLNVNEETRKL